MITSVNLSPIPFQSSTDSTRLQMSSKQIQQALTNLQCEIPYVVGDEYHYLTETSSMGINLARDDGEIVFCNNELMIIHYHKLNKIDVKPIPPIKKVYANFSSKIRNYVPKATEVKKHDILFEYDCFRNGIPSPGYNAYTAYMPWFGYNHEDGLVISESFANKTETTLIDKIYVPIYEYTLLQPLYSQKSNYFNFFPGIGEKITDGIICGRLTPKKVSKTHNPQSNKQNLINILKSMNLSELLNMSNSEINSNFNVTHERSKLDHDSYVHGVKIHRLQKKPLIDITLQKELEQIYSYYNNYLIDVYTELSQYFNQDFCQNLMLRNFVYMDGDKERDKVDLRDAVYLLEFEITQSQKSELGDKFTNLYAGKGVASQILPDEHRPVTKYTNEPIDIIYNTFGVFSRMNYGQIINGMISKTVRYYDQLIRQNKENVKDYIQELNDNVISYLNEEYSQQVQNNIINNLDNDEFRERFLKNIEENNLFIKAKSFSRLNIRDLVQNLIPPNEPVIIKKETQQFMRDKLKCNFDYTITDDIEVKDVFCAPIYTMKLYKLTSKTINARDFGPIESLTGQPTKGRAKKGGSKLGQMEINDSLLCIVIYI